MSVFLSTHGSVDADAAGAEEQNGEEAGEIKICLFVQGALEHRHVAPVHQEFGYTHADDEGEGGEAGEQAEGYQEGAEEFGEDHQDQGDAVAEVDGIGKHILKMSEIPELVEAVVETENEAKCNPQDQHRQIEGGF